MTQRKAKRGPTKRTTYTNPTSNGWICDVGAADSTRRVEATIVAEYCPTCDRPTHASESNDDGVCTSCLGDAAIRPEAI